MKSLQRRNGIKLTIRTLSLFLLAIIYSFPILYMVFSSFKKESDIAPPSMTFRPTLENYRTIIDSDLFLHFSNSLVVALFTVVVTSLLALPISYVIVFGKLRKPTGLYNWYLTTLILPPVAVIIPIYIVLNYLGLLDSRFALVVLYSAIGVPLMVWLCTTYMMDVPDSVIEASKIDGCGRWKSFKHVIWPLIRSGAFSTCLLVFITTWNEFLFAIAFTFTKAGTLPVFMNRYMTQQGLFWGKMSAAATMAMLIPIVLGFVAQKSLIRGITAGAVKE